LLEEFLDAKYKPKHLTDKENQLRQNHNYAPTAPATVYEYHDYEPPAYVPDV
jgi:hypothetical protein